MGSVAGFTMIGWLEGRLAETWHHGSRCGSMVVCQGVGYELQLGERHWQRLPAPGTSVAMHVHTSIREDGWTLFGFPDRIERDLFRELLAVGGVGPQAALGLLSTLEPPLLVQAIVTADLRRLCQAPGVGKRTAERLAVELRQRLRDRFTALLEGSLAEEDPALEGDGEGPEGEQRDELSLTLGALGYEPLEIQRALRAVAGQGLDPRASADDWIRACLRWLSRAATPGNTTR
jgi:Holliday junction DNA helicase RuvA